MKVAALPSLATFEIGPLANPSTLNADVFRRRFAARSTIAAGTLGGGGQGAAKAIASAMSKFAGSVSAGFVGFVYCGDAGKPVALRDTWTRKSGFGDQSEGVGEDVADRVGEKDGVGVALAAVLAEGDTLAVGVAVALPVALAVPLPVAPAALAGSHADASDGAMARTTPKVVSVT